LEKFQDKYRIQSSRLPIWDYGSNAAYFVTICTKDRICWFGKIQDTKMVLSEIGEIANKCWLEINQHFPFVNLDAYIVMPNHIHGIVLIEKPEYKQNKINLVETQDFASLQRQPNSHFNKFGPQSKNLASIIRGFKIGVSNRARLLHPNFSWQPRFHDHIIRNETDYNRICDYILNNPARWFFDSLYV